MLASPDNTAAQNSTVSPTGFGFNNTSWAGQTFTPTVTGQLKRIDVELFCSGCSGTNPDITAFDPEHNHGVEPGADRQRPRHLRPFPASTTAPPAASRR